MLTDKALRERKWGRYPSLDKLLGEQPVRFDEGRELADSPRPAPAYSTPFGSARRILLPLGHTPLSYYRASNFERARLGTRNIFPVGVMHE